MTISVKEIEMLNDKVSAGLKSLEEKPAVKEILLANGYKQEDLDDIKRVQTELNGYYNEKQSKNRTKKAYTAQIEVLKKKSRNHYSVTAHALKRAFDNDSKLLEDLGLRESFKKRTAVFFEKARDLYTKAGDEQILAKVIGYGVNMDSLTAGIKLIDDITALREERHSLRSAKEAATAWRNTAYRELNKKWRSLVKILKHLFKDDPHAVEGIIDVPQHGFDIRRKKKDVVEDPGAEDPGPEEPVSEEIVSQETGVDVVPAEA